MSASDKGS